MRYLRFMLVPLLFIACTDSQPLAPDVNAAPPTDDVSLLASVAAGCEAVRFQVDMVLGPAGGVGTVTGDLVGTISAEFQPGVYHGVAFLGAGTDFIDVTGGTVPGLVGKTVEHQHRNVAVGAWGLGTLARINGHGTIVGPEEVGGHLNFHGSLDISSPPPVVALTYRGNICVG